MIVSNLESKNFGSRSSVSKIIFSVLLIFSVFFLPSSLVADDMEEIIVVGSNFEIEKGQLGSAVTVVTSEMIDALATPYVSDVLRRVPGLAITRTGAGGGFTEVRIRGAEANHVLVIIDGVKVNDANGGFDFSSLVAANIDRIEILRGPQSGLYGSNATAGVINIISRNKQGMGLDVSVEAGSLDYNRETIHAYAASERVSGKLQLLHQESAFDASIYSNALEDDDKDENNSLSGSVKFQLTDIFSVDAGIRYVDKESDVDGSGFFGTALQGVAVDTRGSATLEEKNYFAGINLSLMDGHLINRFSYDYTDRDNQSLTDAGLIDFGDDNSRSKLALSSALIFPDVNNYSHQVAVFFEREKETHKQKTPEAPGSLMFFNPSQGVEKTRVLKGVGVEYRSDFADRLFLSLTARNDNNDAFEDESTYRFTSALWLGDETRMHASVGTGVTNPSFFEQFGFIPATFVGNPGLLPEKSFAWDLGLERIFLDGDFSVDLTYFKADLENEIVTAFDPFTFAATPQNSQLDSDRSGVELSFQGNFLRNISLSGAYTYTNSQQNDQREVRRPQNTASLDIQYVLFDDRAKINFGALYSGTQLDNDFRMGSTGQSRLDSYLLLNVGASYQLSSVVNIFSSINNLLDEDYQEVISYQTPGRYFNLGLSLSF